MPLARLLATGGFVIAASGLLVAAQFSLVQAIGGPPACSRARWPGPWSPGSRCRGSSCSRRSSASAPVLIVRCDLFCSAVSVKRPAVGVKGPISAIIRRIGDS